MITREQAFAILKGRQDFDIVFNKIGRDFDTWLGEPTRTIGDVFTDKVTLPKIIPDAAEILSKLFSDAGWLKISVQPDPESTKNGFTHIVTLRLD